MHEYHTKAVLILLMALEMCRVADPFRHLVDSVGTLFNPMGTVVDKLRVGVFRLKVLMKTQEEIDTSPQTTTLQYLRVRSPPHLFVVLRIMPLLVEHCSAAQYCSSWVCQACSSGT